MREDKALDFIEVESWQRQPGETNAAFHGFCLYRDYGGDRSVKKVLEANGYPPSRIGVWLGWSKRFLWVRRCKEYDVHLDCVRQQAREEAFKMRDKKHLELTCKMLEIVEKRLESFDPSSLGSTALMDWMKGATDMERKSFSDVIKGNDEGQSQQMQLNFFEDFKGV